MTYFSGFWLFRFSHSSYKYALPSKLLLLPTKGLRITVGAPPCVKVLTHLHSIEKYMNNYKLILLNILFIFNLVFKMVSYCFEMVKSCF